MLWTTTATLKEPSAQSVIAEPHPEQARNCRSGALRWPQDFIVRSSGINLIYGGDAEDTVESRDGDDLIYGGDDRDYLYGEAGNDTIDGGAGWDYINGGSGSDSCTDAYAKTSC